MISTKNTDGRDRVVVLTDAIQHVAEGAAALLKAGAGQDSLAKMSKVLNALCDELLAEATEEKA